MSALPDGLPPALEISVSIEGSPVVRLVALNEADEIALKEWLSRGFAKRDIERALADLDDSLKEAA